MDKIDPPNICLRTKIYETIFHAIFRRTPSQLNCFIDQFNSREGQETLTPLIFPYISDLWCHSRFLIYAEVNNDNAIVKSSFYAVEMRHAFQEIMDEG